MAYDSRNGKLLGAAEIDFHELLQGASSLDERSLLAASGARRYAVYKSSSRSATAVQVGVVEVEVCC